MKYLINSKNVKQSVSTLSKYLKEKGFNIPHNTMLDGFSKALFLKNWNALQSVMTKPETIKDIKIQYQYIMELSVDIDKTNLSIIIEKAFLKANAKLNIESFMLLNTKVAEKNYIEYQIVFNLEKNGENFLMGLMMLCEEIKKITVPQSMDFCRIKVEKESLMNYFDNQSLKLSLSEQKKLDPILKEWKLSQDKFKEEALKYSKNK